MTYLIEICECPPMPFMPTDFSLEDTDSISHTLLQQHRHIFKTGIRDCETPSGLIPSYLVTYSPDSGGGYPIAGCPTRGLSPGDYSIRGCFIGGYFIRGSPVVGCPKRGWHTAGSFYGRFIPLEVVLSSFTSSHSPSPKLHVLRALKL